MEPTKKPLGAPRKENGERLYLTIRASAERKARYAAAAERAGETLSAWIKRILDRAAKR